MNTPQLPNFKPSAMKENKSGNPANLQFFSGSTIERMEIEINNVLALLQLERISYQQAHLKLHDARKDMMTIYYDICGKIAKAQSTVSTMRRYGKIDHERVLETSQRMISEIELPSHGNRVHRALKEVVKVSDKFSDGTALFRELSRSIQDARKVIKNETGALQKDLLDHLFRAKRLNKSKVVPSLKASDLGYTPDPILDETVEPEDMLVKKILS